MRYPLEDVKVLDLSHALAGPFCTMLLADYGARVYKLEPPGAGDIGRGWGPPFLGEDSAFFLGLQRNKLGLSMDLKHPEGRELCLRLMEKIDVVVENFRPGSLERLGLGYEEASRRNPRLIYCSISGYGQTGPARDLPAMDLVLQAACGLISVTGVRGGETVRCGHSVADISAGMFAAFAITMALYARERTGAGQFLDVSMLDSMIAAMNSNFANHLGSGRVPGPMGTAFTTIVPYRTFPTADRDIAIAVASDKLWEAFCPAIGRSDLTEDPALFDQRLARREPRHIGAAVERAVPAGPERRMATAARAGRRALHAGAHAGRSGDRSTIGRARNVSRCDAPGCGTDPRPRAAGEDVGDARARPLGRAWTGRAHPRRPSLAAVPG